MNNADRTGNEERNSFIRYQHFWFALLLKIVLKWFEQDDDENDDVVVDDDGE